MRRQLQLLLPCLVATMMAACDKDASGPRLLDCEQWSVCEGALVLRSEIASSNFGRQRADKYVPGDSVLVRITIENRANIRSDSLEIYYEANGVLSRGALYPIVLEAGEQRIEIDTVIVGGYNFAEPGELEFEVLRYFTSTAVPATITGTAVFPIASSGFALEVLVPPAPVLVFQDNGHTYTGSRLRYYQSNAMSIRISNPYELPLNGLTLGMCVWDQDHCFDIRQTRLHNVVNSGSHIDVDYEFSIDELPDSDSWYLERYVRMSLCGHRAFGGLQCQWRDILLSANFEAECAVAALVTGATTTDAAPECGPWDNRGSVYRFEGVAGAQYRVVSVQGNPNAFFSPRNGVRGEARPTEFTIPSNGTYYVVVLHDGPVAFRVERIS